MKLLEETKKFVNSSFEPERIPHFKRTLYWIKKLKPDADLALQIAAYAHDVGQAGRPLSDIKKLGWDKWSKFHAEEGEKIITQFLKEHNADEALIKQVAFLIRHHEWGGTAEADILKDADSISAFETNRRAMIDRADTWGLDKTEEKIKWMFNRITSKKAKEIVRPMYEASMKELEKL